MRVINSDFTIIYRLGQANKAVKAKSKQQSKDLIQHDKWCRLWEIKSKTQKEILRKWSKSMKFFVYSIVINLISPDINCCLEYLKPIFKLFSIISIKQNLERKTSTAKSQFEQMLMLDHKYRELKGQYILNLNNKDGSALKESSSNPKMPQIKGASKESYSSMADSHILKPGSKSK